MRPKSVVQGDADGLRRITRNRRSWYCEELGRAAVVVVNLAAAMGAQTLAGRGKEKDGDRPWAINDVEKLQEAPAAACVATVKLLHA